MGVIKFGIKMLIKERKKSILYLISIIFFIVLILNDFNIIFNTDFLENDYHELKQLASLIAFTVLIGGLIFITFASLYFVYGKTKIISLSLVSGRSSYSVGLLIGVQNLALGFIGMITGIIIGVSSIPLINTLAYLGISEEVKTYKISSVGILATIIVGLTTLIMVTLVGMGYAYRSELVDLLKDTKMKHRKQESTSGFRKSGAFCWTLYFVPILCLLLPISIEDKSRLMPMVELVTLISVSRLIKTSIPKIIGYYKSKYYKYDKINTLAFNNLLRILDDSKYVLLFLLFSVIILVLIYIDAWTTDKVRVVILISYVAVVIVSSLTMMYKILIDAVNNNNSFKQLKLIGYTKVQINKILNLEVSLFYFIVVNIPFIHILAMLLTSAIAGNISFGLALTMIGIFIFLFGIAYVISLIGYRKVIFKELQGVK